MNGDAHTRWSEDLPAYLLGALEPERVAGFERHLEGCERCRAELRWLGVAAEALPEAVARRQPPTGLRERLMAEVGADAADAGSAREAARPAGWRRRFAAWRRGAGAPVWRPLAGAAALVLLVAAVAGYVVGNDSGGGSGTRTVVVPQPSGIDARVVEEGGRGEIRLTHVERLPRGRVLEAWVQREGEVEPVRALFAPDGEGRASTPLGDMRGVEAVMVTREPAGGSPAPTTTPIVTVSIPQ